jgi:hypothetical protein
MLSPFLILPKKNRSDEEVAGWERQQAKLGQDYDSPWLSALVTFSGFVAAFIGSVDVLFVIANLRHGTVWIPYALVLAALVGAHLFLRAGAFGDDVMTGNRPLAMMDERHLTDTPARGHMAELH